MALNNLGLGFIFTAKDRASATIAGLNTRMSTLGKSSKKAGMGAAGALVGIGAGAATAAAGLAGVKAAWEAADFAGEFQQGLAQVSGITRASAEDMARLEQKAIEAGLATKFTPAEAIQGLKELSVLGFNASEAIDTLDASLTLAMGGQIEIADAAVAVGAAMRVFGIEASKSGETADKLLSITQKTALQANDLALAMSKISRGAVPAKQSLDEMLISIGLVKNTGAEASVAATGVSSAIQFLAKNTPRLKELGVSATDAQGRFRKFGDIVLDTSRAIESQMSNQAERVDAFRSIFGRFGASAAVALHQGLKGGVRSATGELLFMEDALEELRKTQGAALGRGAEFVEKMLATWQGQKDLLRGALGTIATIAGQAFQVILKPIISVFYLVSTKLAQAFFQLPKPLKVALAAIFLLGMGFLFVVGAGAALALTLTLLAPFLLIMAKVALIAGAAFLAFGAILGVFALAAVGAWLAVKNNWGGMGQWFAELKDKVTTAWGALKDIVSGKGIEASTRDLLQQMGLWNLVSGIAYIVRGARAFWQGMVQGFKRGLQKMAPAWEQLKVAVNELIEVFGMLTNEFAMSSGGASTMIQRGATLGGVLAMLVRWLVKGVTWVLLIGNAFVKAGLWIKGVFGGALEVIIWMLEMVLALVKTLGNALLWLGTLGQAEIDWGGAFKDLNPVDRVRSYDEAMAKRRGEMQRIGVVPEAAGPRGGAYPAEQYVEGFTGAGGVAAISADDIARGTATGMAQALASTPIRLEGDVEGDTLFTMLGDIQREVRNRGGAKPGTITIPGGSFE